MLFRRQPPSSPDAPDPPANGRPGSSAITLADRLAGAVWGHLVGDAAGLPYQYCEPERVGRFAFGKPGGVHDRPPGTWSDDGALMLAVLDSLLHAELDPADQGRRILDWADRGAYTPDGEGRFDIGGATAAALERLRRGGDALASGGQAELDNGSGSLVRSLPVALVGRDLPTATLVDWARRSSRVTHAHPRAELVCALYALVARELLTEEHRAAAAARAIEELGELVPRSEQREFDLILHAKMRRGTRYVVDTFWSAWDAFCRADDYPSVIQRAVAYGHATDTTAAVAGGLAGCYWGQAALPRPWLERMRGRDVVEPLVDELTASGPTTYQEPSR